MATIDELLRYVGYERHTWDNARDTAEQAKDHLVAAVREAHTAGASEYALAAAAGVDRSTVRRWLGKSGK